MQWGVFFAPQDKWVSSEVSQPERSLNKYFTLAGNFQPMHEKVTNIVFMGMGEPFHNYEATLKAIDLLNDVDGFNMGARRFTISTVGIVPQIIRFADEKGRSIWQSVCTPLMTIFAQI